MTRRATIILALLLVVLQGQLWFGRGSFTEVWQLEQQLIEHRRQNEQTEQWTVEWEFQLRVCDATGTAIVSKN